MVQRFALWILVFLLGSVMCVDQRAWAQESLAPVVEENAMDPSPNARFPNCDGFPGVSRRGDGVMRASRGVDVIVRYRPPFLRSIEYCDLAISTLESTYPQYWIRRTTLLEGRAIFKLIEGDHVGALEDVAAAEASAQAPYDEHLARTLTVNNELIRALALEMQGDESAARELTMRAVQRRPYSLNVLTAALMILSSDPPESLLSRWRRLSANARVPERNLQDFYMAMLDPESGARDFRGGGGDLYFNRLSGPYVGGSPMQLARQCDDRAEGAFSNGPDGANICYFTMNLTQTLAQERVLIRAAEETLRRGATGFSLQARRDVTHWAQSPYARREIFIGYFSAASVVFHTDTCPDCFDPAEVLAALEVSRVP